MKEKQKKQAKRPSKPTKADIVKKINAWAAIKTPDVTLHDLEFLEEIIEASDAIFHDKTQTLEDQLWACHTVVEIIDFKLKIATQGIPVKMPSFGRGGNK